MEAQVENAIEIAFNPRSDQALKAQALEFVNQLRNEPQGWSVCLPLAIKQPRASDVVRHVSLDVVNTAVHGRLEVQELVFAKDNILQHVRSTYGPGAGADPDPPTVENKIVQTITYLFRALYASEWQSFFDDLLALAGTPDGSPQAGINGARFYIKVACSIHDEIGDTMIARSRDEQQRDNDLKDLIRERDAAKVTSSWRELLLRYRGQNDAVVEQCLLAVGKWASWLDLSLIIDDQLLSTMYDLVSAGVSSQNDTASHMRDVSLNTFMEILGKKMKGEDKLQLIQLLKINPIVSQLATSAPLQDLRFTSNYDTDLAELVARLVNNVVNEIVVILDAANPADAVTQDANVQLKMFLPFALRFFSDEYDEICASVIPCITDVLTLFRRKSANDSDYISLLPSILQAIIAKMKYDETSEWGNEEALTDEAEFTELRKRLHVLQQAVAAVNEPLFIETISNLVATAFDNFQSRQGHVDWRDLDLALHEMFLFGQLGAKGGSLYSKGQQPTNAASARLIAMMAKLIECDVASFPHPAIHLQFMEICVRYYNFFQANPASIPPALTKFVQFVHHDNLKVKRRSWYLFHRFVKHLRQHIGDISQTVLQAVNDLLPIKAELPEEGSDDGDMSSDENDQSADARFTSQLYLYEALGNIFSVSAIPVDNQVLYVRAVMEPLFTDLQNHLSPAQAGDERAILQVHHLIMALGTLAHGFSEWLPARPVAENAPAKEVSAEFGRAAEAILVALESLHSSLDVRTAARSAFSHLMGVLGNRILQHLPRWIEGLLSQASSKDEMATFLRLLDQVVYGFRNEIEGILNSLLTPLLQRVSAGMAEPPTGTDDEIQLSELKGQYLGFILVILSNDLGRVFVSDENQPVFEDLIWSLERFAKDSNDLPTAKLSFGVLTKMVHTWGGPDIVMPKQPVLPDASPQPNLPGFDRFMMERFSPLCWALPSSENFNVADAQARQALGEAALMKKAIFSKTGQQYLDWLRDGELRGTGMDEASIQEFLKALSELEAKQFRTYFQTLLSRTGR